MGCVPVIDKHCLLINVKEKGSRKGTLYIYNNIVLRLSRSENYISSIGTRREDKAGSCLVLN